MCSEELKSSDAFGAAGGFGAGRRAYVLVNNLAEGNAPLTPCRDLWGCCGARCPQAVPLSLIR
jgi:hypothetical protein